MIEIQLGLELLRVVEQAAIASARTMGLGDRHKSDEVAVQAMRQMMDHIPMDGTIGERPSPLPLRPSPMPVGSMLNISLRRSSCPDSEKRAETRDKRIATAVEWIAEGKQRNWKYQNC